MEHKYIDKYIIKRELGRGAMGSVLLGFNPHTEQHVAIKILPPEYNHNKTALLRFQQEAKIAARIRHPNVIQIYDAGFDNKKGIHFIVAEYIEGKNLDQYLKSHKGLMPQNKAIHITKCVAFALKEAQKLGIVHRDIKPANIMISVEDEQVKLADLGIAKMIGNELGLTCTGQAIGTPYYMSPEQIREDPKIDTRSDIWSLGATFHHILTGKVPFDAGSEFELKSKINSDPTPYLCDLSKDFPKDLADLVYKMMEKRPENRFQNPTDLLAALNDIGKGDTLLGIKSPDFQGTVAFQDTLVSTKKKRPRNWKLILTVGGLALIIVLGVIALLLGKRGALPAPPSEFHSEMANRIMVKQRTFVDEIEEVKLKRYALQHFLEFEKAVKKAVKSEVAQNTHDALDQINYASRFLDSTRIMADSNRNKLQKSAERAKEKFQKSRDRLPRNLEQDYPIVHSISRFLNKNDEIAYKLSPEQFKPSEDFEKALTIFQFGNGIVKEIENLCALIDKRNEIEDEFYRIKHEDSDLLETYYKDLEELNNKIRRYKDFDVNLRAPQTEKILKEEDVQKRQIYLKTGLSKSIDNWEKASVILNAAISESEIALRKFRTNQKEAKKAKLIREKETKLAREKEAKLAREKEAKLAREKEAKLIREKEAKLTREKEAKLAREKEAANAEAIRQKAENWEKDADIAIMEGNFDKAKQLYLKTLAIYNELNLNAKALQEKLNKFETPSQKEKFKSQVFRIQKRAESLNTMKAHTNLISELDKLYLDHNRLFGQHLDCQNIYDETFSVIQKGFLRFQFQELFEKIDNTKTQQELSKIRTEYQDYLDPNEVLIQEDPQLKKIITDILNTLYEKEILIKIESVKLKLNLVESPEVLRELNFTYEQLTANKEEVIGRSKKIQEAIIGLKAIFENQKIKFIFLKNIDALKINLVKAQSALEFKDYGIEFYSLKEENKNLIDLFEICKTAVESVEDIIQNGEKEIIFLAKIENLRSALSSSTKKREFIKLERQISSLRKNNLQLISESQACQDAINLLRKKIRNQKRKIRSVAPPP